MARKTKERIRRVPRSTRNARANSDELIGRTIDQAIAKVRAINRIKGLSERHKDQLKQSCLKNLFRTQARRIFKRKHGAYRARTPKR